MTKKTKDNNSNNQKIIQPKSITIKINSDSKSLTSFSNSEIFKIYLQKILTGNIYNFNKTFNAEIFKEKTLLVIVDYSPKEPNHDKSDTENQETRIAVSDATIIHLNGEKIAETNKNPFFLESEELSELKLLVEHNLLCSDDPIFPLKGIILKGGSGTGKTANVKRIMESFRNKIKFFLYDQNEFVKNCSLNENSLYKQQPFLIVIDELRKNDENEKLKELFKNIKFLKGLVIGCIKSDVSEDFDNVRGCGMFEKDIEISLPDSIKRKRYINHYFDIIFNKLQLNSSPRNLEEDHKEINSIIKEKNQMKLLRTDFENFSFDKMIFDDNFYEALSLKSPGFTYLDLKNLIREIEFLISNKQKFNIKIITKAFDNIIPQNLRNQNTKFNKTTYSEIGGYEDVKRQLKTVIELPLKHPEIFLRKGITPSKGILLYGPPGCSKTMFARALATESNLNFISVKGPEIFDKYVGNSEKKIRDIFKKARFCAPTIIFFDEIDALACKREEKTGVSDRILTQLLTEIDGVDVINKIHSKFESKTDGNNKEQSGFGKADIFANNMVVIVGATNRPDILDPAILRPGRFDQLIFIDLPDLTARKHILSLQVKKMKIEEIFDLDHFANLLEGYSGAEIIQICKEAAMRSIYSGDIQDDTVYKKDFDYAIDKVKPRIKKELLLKFQNFHKNN